MALFLSPFNKGKRARIISPRIVQCEADVPLRSSQFDTLSASGDYAIPDHAAQAPPHAQSDLLFLLDLTGTLVFSIEGALTAISHDLDLLGIMVLAFSTALAGGIIRDVFIGAVPPNSLRDWRYPVTAFVGAAIVFFWHPFVRQIPVNVIMLFDAGGLALFAVAGTEKALLYKMNPLIATLLGTITGVGGGTVRDILLATVPSVLYSDVYATAALAGSVVMVVCRRLGLPSAVAAILGGVVCFLLRVVSVWRHWNLPHVSLS
jgi:uncharacterized membrane protein YeiH